MKGDHLASIGSLDYLHTAAPMPGADRAAIPLWCFILGFHEQRQIVRAKALHMQSQTWSEAAPWCRFSIALQQVTANEEDTLWVKLDDCNIHDSKAKRVRALLCSPCTPRPATTGSTLVRF